MADLQNLVITELGPGAVNTTRATISCQVTDSATGAVIADYTGANAITFPGVIRDLTTEQRQVLLWETARLVAEMKAGIR